MDFIFTSSLLVTSIFGAGFDYPVGPGPIDMQNAVIITVIPFISQYETPIQIRFTSIIDETFWQCLAVYHPTALDVFTKERPAVVADNDTIAQYGTSETRMLCSAYASLMVANTLFPEGSTAAAELLDSLSLNSSFLSMNSDVANCSLNDSVCLQEVAESYHFYPEIMASIIAKQMIDFLENDGWNADGSIGSDGEECTANCIPYGDTTGYEPDDQNATGYGWQRLTESNGKGFSYQYNHVVPHIGSMAVTKTISRAELESKNASSPDYDYDAEIPLVIERLADLATNDTAKMMVEFFDDKIAVVVSILFALDSLLQWTWEERQVFLTGESAAEYDAVLQVWNEKVKWDRVRPTTLIKNKGNELITTYGGPGRGVQTIKSRDFEAYKRVMPHSEYPSGSSCICSVAARFTETLLEERYNITDPFPVQIPFPGAPFAAGSSTVEPAITPSEDLFIGLDSLSQLSDLCGESRLWGGMHFTAAVPAGIEVCDGIGSAGYQFVVDLLDGHPLHHDVDENVSWSSTDDPNGNDVVNSTGNPPSDSTNDSRSRSASTMEIAVMIGVAVFVVIMLIIGVATKWYFGKQKATDSEEECTNTVDAEEGGKSKIVRDTESGVVENEKMDTVQ